MAVAVAKVLDNTPVLLVFTYLPVPTPLMVALLPRVRLKAPISIKPLVKVNAPFTVSTLLSVTFDELLIVKLFMVVVVEGKLVFCAAAALKV